MGEGPKHKINHYSQTRSPRSYDYLKFANTNTYHTKAVFLKLCAMKDLHKRYRLSLKFLKFIRFQNATGAARL